MQKTDKKVYIETLGCQMNVNDSELMAGLLAKEGFALTHEEQEADLLVLNTCQIRGSAEDKAFSYAGYWRRLKRKNPDLKIAMAGCVAQQAKESIFKRLPHVDMVFGTQNIKDLPELIKRVYAGEEHVLLVEKTKTRSNYDYHTDVAPIRESDISAWVTIIEGCDYFCTYCVVPYTRGRQISRQPYAILDEIKKLADYGFKEVTLLGQTVDSYGKDFTGQQYDLADLLHAVHDINGIERIRFMTSHPLDLSDRIIEAVAELPRVMEHIHIPMQAGDNTVLERMRRGHTAQQYYDLVDKIYDRIPGVSVSGDYIVGFPGETDAQFEQTLYSIKRAGLYNANTAIYSAREQTPAALWQERGEEVPEDIKRERLVRANAIVREQAHQQNKQLEGSTVEVLVEGKSRRNEARLTGRTRTNRVVNFESSLPEDTLVGQLVQIHITEALPFSLLGQHVISTSLDFNHDNCLSGTR